MAKVTLSITDYEMKQHVRGRAQNRGKLQAALKRLAVDRVKAGFDLDVSDQDIQFERGDDGWRFSVYIVAEAKAPVTKTKAPAVQAPAKPETPAVKTKAPAKPKKPVAKIVEKKAPAKPAKKKAPTKKAGA